MVRSPKKSAAKTVEHPKYEEMVGKAIIDDASRSGTSRPTLIKYLAANWNLSPDHVQTQLKTQLPRMVAKGWLVPNKASFRLSPEARAALKKGPAKAKKPAAKKPAAKRAGAKKPAAKRAGAKKPAAKRASAKKPAAKRSLKRAGTMATTAKSGKAFVKRANKKAKAASRK
jgi:linker histone H1 and H5 family